MTLFQRAGRTKGHSREDLNISLLFIDVFLKESLPIHREKKNSEMHHLLKSCKTKQFTKKKKVHIVV